MVCIIAFTLSLVGMITLADWQSLGGDPCRQLTDKDCFNSSDGGNLEYLFSNNNSCPVFHNATTEELYYNATALCGDEQCVCDAINNVTDYQCFWNPLSRITGDYCERCRHVCLSKTRSLNFIQLIFGVIFFLQAFPWGA